jgi:hypothetical protein
MKVITRSDEPAEQPPLPPDFPWHPMTLKWWKMWGDSPLMTDATENDWSELLDTAILHTQLWNGDVKAAGELRLRVAKFGATPEDRARLRIQFATADHRENQSRVPAPTPSSQNRRRLIGN